MSASVQWVAIRMIDTPRSATALDVVDGADPGQQQGSDLGSRAAVDGRR